MDNLAIVLGIGITVGFEPFVLGILAAWVISGGLLAKGRPIGVFVAAMFALGVSLYLGFQHHAAAGVSACSVSAIFDCDTVNRSEYSEMFGIPIAFLGSGFYAAVMAAMAMFIRRPESFKRAPHVVVLGSIVAVGYSIFLAVMSAKLGAWCLFCISLYGFNAIMLAGAWVAVEESKTPLVVGLKRAFLGKEDQTASTMSMVGAVAFLMGMAAYQQLPDAPTPLAEEDVELGRLYEAPDGELELDGSEPVLGDPNAPYTIVEFADFQCPYCGQIAPQLHELVYENPNIKVLFKHYPISGICNDQVQGDRHSNSCQAAAAAECAHLQGRFWEMDRVMFQNQQYLEPDDLRFIAGQVGLEMESFEACMTSAETEAAIRADVAHAAKVGVHGTPALFLSGIRPDEWVMVSAGPEGAALLVQAHMRGEEIPPASASHSHQE